MTEPSGRSVWDRAHGNALAVPLAGMGLMLLLVWASFAVRGATPIGNTAETKRDSLSVEPTPAPEKHDTADEQAAGMRRGLDALRAREPVTAAAHFRAVLAINPEHYGATFQLGTALDQAGDLRAAKPVWEKVLSMALAVGDAESSERARARLAEIEKLAAASHDPAAAKMKLGLDALYVKGDPAAAAALFREILKENPEHYGATFQLATALERDGNAAKARPLWAKVLKMAEAVKDEKTAAEARARLAAGKP